MLGLRVILGVFEAGYFPGCAYLLSTWYTRYELQKRNAVFFLIGSMANGLSGILAYGLIEMGGLGHLSGWRWIFVVRLIPPIPKLSFTLPDGRPPNHPLGHPRRPPNRRLPRGKQQIIPLPQPPRIRIRRLPHCRRPRRRHPHSLHTHHLPLPRLRSQNLGLRPPRLLRRNKHLRNRVLPPLNPTQFPALLPPENPMPDRTTLCRCCACHVLLRCLR